jgi:succinate-semialdehyde dehydrogenase/glutarate-semialdehyde dehydrogenase
VFESIDPSTGVPFESYRAMKPAQWGGALTRAESAFEEWRAQQPGERAELLRRVAGVLRESGRTHAELITREMGKPIREAEAEVEKCATLCDYYAENGPGFLQPIPVRTEARRSYVRFDPLGAVLAIMPWNFPYWQVFRCVVPALMAGNVVLLKHASNVTGCALAMERVFEQAGLRAGAFQALLVRRGVIPKVLDHPLVAGVALTGSDAAGRDVAARAGRRLRKTVLELGGSDPFIVLDDVDARTVGRAAVRARVINSGQSCIAAKRFIVLAPVFEPFLAAFRDALQELRVGDPMDPDTDVGPLAREDLAEDLDRQVRESVALGAELRFGGKRLDRPGFFYMPTLLVGGDPQAPAAREETFGPLAHVQRATSDEHAIELANRTPFGLGASIWSADVERAERMVARIEAGCVFVNAAVKSDPRLPFGGVKDSGYGRELADFGLREFTNVKSVWVDDAER